jgi:hypothetical protein
MSGASCYELLVHVSSVLSSGSLLDGRSWLLGAYNKVWKHQLLHHSNSGGGRANKSEGDAPDKQSEAGRHRQLAERAAREDLSALKAIWAYSDPKIRKYAAKWGQDGIEMRVAFSGQH